MQYDDVSNVYTALTIRSMNKEVKLLSLLVKSKNRKKLMRAGVNEVVHPQELVGLVAKEFSGMPVAFEAIHALRSQHSDILTQELVIDEYILSQCKVIGDLNPQKYRILLMGISPYSSKKFKFNPSDDVALNVGDILLVIGNNVLIEEFKKNLHRKRKS